MDAICATAFLSRKFNPKDHIPDLSGKVVIVTGGNAGIGASTVSALAVHNPACIYLCSRTQSSAQAVVDSVHRALPKARIQILALDLASFRSVKKCVNEFNSKSDRLDLLFLNAGVFALAHALTEDGYELQFGINHMGHALFTKLLMPKLLQTLRDKDNVDVRIMVASTIGGYQSAPRKGLILEKMKTKCGSISPITLYGHSKLANMLFARKLAQLYPRITTVSFHPGVVKTSIWKKADGAKVLLSLIAPFVWLAGINSDSGAKTGLWCTSANNIINGRYYEPVGVARNRSRHARDQKLADELWEWINMELAEHGIPEWPGL